MTGKNIIKSSALLLALVCIYSLVPQIVFTFKRSPDKTVLNQEAVKDLGKLEGSNFSFIVLSDTSSGLMPAEGVTLKIISRMNGEDRFKKSPIDFAANVGDVTFRGRPGQFKTYVKLKAMIKYPVIDVKGNHDDDFDNAKDGRQLFTEYCGEKEFSFACRNSYFIVLDDSSGELTDAQFVRLENELKAGAKYAHIFIFMHKPPFNVYQQSWYRPETNPWSYRFMKMCEQYKVGMVFSGHEYIYRVAEFGGVKYAVSGGGGAILVEAPAEAGASHNYFVVKVNGDYIDYEVRKVAPPIWEYLAIYMWKDLYYFVKDALN